MKKIAIIGGGEHAKKVAIEIEKVGNFDLIGFVDEKYKNGKLIQKINNKNLKVISNLNGLKDNRYKNVGFIIGIGNNYTRYKVIKDIKKKKLKIKFYKVISKNAVINGDVKIGNGTVIFSGSVISNESKIGRHCFIGPNSTLEHNNVFHNFSSCGAGVNCGGNVKLGEFSFLGIGSSVKHKVKIENNCIIGGHSLVLKNCKKNSLYFGVPAERKKEWKFNDSYL